MEREYPLKTPQDAEVGQRRALSQYRVEPGQSNYESMISVSYFPLSRQP